MERAAEAAELAERFLGEFDDDLATAAWAAAAIRRYNDADQDDAATQAIATPAIRDAAGPGVPQAAAFRDYVVAAGYVPFHQMFALGDRIQDAIDDMAEFTRRHDEGAATEAVGELYADVREVWRRNARIPLREAIDEAIASLRRERGEIADMQDRVLAVGAELSAWIDLFSEAAPLPRHVPAEQRRAILEQVHRELDVDYSAAPPAHEPAPDLMIFPGAQVARMLLARPGEAVRYQEIAAEIYPDLEPARAYRRIGGLLRDHRAGRASPLDDVLEQAGYGLVEDEIRRAPDGTSLARAVRLLRAVPLAQLAAQTAPPEQRLALAPPPVAEVPRLADASQQIALFLVAHPGEQFTYREISERVYGVSADRRYMTRVLARVRSVFKALYAEDNDEMDAVFARYGMQWHRTEMPNVTVTGQRRGGTPTRLVYVEPAVART